MNKSFLLAALIGCNNGDIDTSDTSDTSDTMGRYDTSDTNDTGEVVDDSCEIVFYDDRELGVVHVAVKTKMGEILSADEILESSIVHSWYDGRAHFETSLADSGGVLTLNPYVIPGHSLQKRENELYGNLMFDVDVSVVLSSGDGCSKSKSFDFYDSAFLDEGYETPVVEASADFFEDSVQDAFEDKLVVRVPFCDMGSDDMYVIVQSPYTGDILKVYNVGSAEVFESTENINSAEIVDGKLIVMATDMFASEAYNKFAIFDATTGVLEDSFARTEYKKSELKGNQLHHNFAALGSDMIFAPGYYDEHMNSNILKIRFSSGVQVSSAEEWFNPLEVNPDGGKYYCNTISSSDSGGDFEKNVLATCLDTKFSHQGGEGGVDIVVAGFEDKPSVLFVEEEMVDFVLSQDFEYEGLAVVGLPPNPFTETAYSFVHDGHFGEEFAVFLNNVANPMDDGIPDMSDPENNGILSIYNTDIASGSADLVCYVQLDSDNPAGGSVYQVDGSSVFGGFFSETGGMRWVMPVVDGATGQCKVVGAQRTEEGVDSESRGSSLWARKTDVKGMGYDKSSLRYSFAQGDGYYEEI